MLDGPAIVLGVFDPQTDMHENAQGIHAAHRGRTDGEGEGTARSSFGPRAPKPDMPPPEEPPGSLATRAWFSVAMIGRAFDTFIDPPGLRNVELRGTIGTARICVGPLWNLMPLSPSSTENTESNIWSTFFG